MELGFGNLKHWLIVFEKLQAMRLGPFIPDVRVIVLPWFLFFLGRNLGYDLQVESKPRIIHNQVRVCLWKNFPNTCNDCRFSFVLNGSRERDPFRFRENRRRDQAKDKVRSEEHTSELQSPDHLVCRLLLE